MNSYEQRQEARRERLLRIADKLQSEGNARYMRAKQMAEAIPFGQPILVGHYSEGRDRRYRAKIHNNFGKAFSAMNKAKELERRAEAVGTGGISSDDPEAVVKLRAELAQCEQAQARMKAANTAIRKNAKAGFEAQVAALVTLGFTEASAAKAIKPDFCGRIGFPDYALKNNNANVRRIKGRIAQLERRTAEVAAAEETGETQRVIECAGFNVVINLGLNRVQVKFPGKPDATVRSRLKSSGFRWSPAESAWQKMLNAYFTTQPHEFLRKDFERLIGA